ncbi:hypothetical protein FOVG_19870, partial [Fusarium oxysporum f. sp. pisi HDV247]
MDSQVKKVWDNRQELADAIAAAVGCAKRRIV